VLRIPLAELVAEGEHALLGARLFLVAACSADGSVETEFRNGLQQRYRLRGVPAFIEAAQLDRAAADRILDRAHDKPLTELGNAGVSKRDHLRKIVPGVDMHERKRKPCRTERLFRQAQQYKRILAAGKKRYGVGAFAGDLSQDENRLRFEPVQMASGGQGAALGVRLLQDRAHASLVAAERTRRPSAATCS